MYQLYHNKDNLELKIEPDKYGTFYSNNEVHCWNDNYYKCNEIKPLRSKAEEIRQKWIKEYQERLDKLENLKIKVKYK
jgi:hypothetical protein